MDPQHTGIEHALEQFLRSPSYRSFRPILDYWGRAHTLPPDLGHRMCDAVFQAAESPDWRLARVGIPEMGSIAGGLKRKADIIARGLLSKCESVRVASWGAITCSRHGLRLSRMVLSRLEAKPTPELMLWEVLMAVDQMADHLTARRDRQRLVHFVKRLEAHGTRSYLVEWKIEETLYSHLHLNQPREEQLG